MSLQTMLCTASNSGVRRCSCCKETENDRYLNQIDINEYTTLFLCRDCLKDFVNQFTRFTRIDSSELLEFNKEKGV